MVVATVVMVAVVVAAWQRWRWWELLKRRDYQRCLARRRSVIAMSRLVRHLSAASVLRLQKERERIEAREREVRCIQRTQITRVKCTSPQIVGHTRPFHDGGR